jgi:flagellar biosynthesis protein
MMEKRREVVALKYDQVKQDSPYVVAKGRGLVADEILARAKENDIPIQEDPSLLEVLSKLEINESIPEELYQVVAEVFAFIYKVDKHYKG